MTICYGCFFILIYLSRIDLSKIRPENCSDIQCNYKILLAIYYFYRAIYYKLTFIMANKVQIDATDRMILSFLIKNARTPFLEIARACGISGAAIHQRIRKLEDSGIISGSKFTVKPKAVGFDICAFVGILLDKAHVYNHVIREIEKIPEIVECHFTTGNWSLLVKIYCVDNQHLMNVLVYKMQNIPGVAKTETFISLEQTIDREFSI